jgi:hypothetical protein
MADNYVDIPMLVLKLRSAAAITTGYLLQADSVGYKNCADSDLAVGMMAMEPATDSAQYFDALVIGTAYFGYADSFQAGLNVTYSAAGKMEAADSGKHDIGISVDRATTDTATRAYRVFLWGASTDAGADCWVDTA